VRKSVLYAFGLVVAALVALGLIVLSSAGEANGFRLHGDVYYFLKRQVLFVVAGLFVATAVALFDYHHWRNHLWVTIVFVGVVVLLLCAVYGFRPINGSRRWLPCGPIRMQPSEFAKLATVILIAVWMDKVGWRVELFKQGVLVPSLLIAVFAGLVVTEPDYGSTMVIGLAGFLVMFVGGAKFLHMLPLVLLGGAGGAALVLTNANRVARLFDEKKLYQVKMALAAIGNGGVLGRGLNNSMQKYAYLPEAHTDFVFAVGAEELGLLFSIAVLLLFLTFFALSIYIARKASDRFGRLLVVGMSFIIFFQAMFNLGVVCKALPTKGMALPFFSYGGTNLVSAFFAVGMILSVGIHSWRDRKRVIKQNVFV